MDIYDLWGMTCLFGMQGGKRRRGRPRRASDSPAGIWRFIELLLAFVIVAAAVRLAVWALI